MMYDYAKTAILMNLCDWPITEMSLHTFDSGSIGEERWGNGFDVTDNWISYYSIITAFTSKEYWR